MTDKSQKQTYFLLFFALFASILAFLPYIPSLSNGFVNWDDHVYIYNNKNLFLRSGELIKWAFTSTTAGQWHPLASLTHALEVRIFGLEPFGHHLVSSLLHSINTFIVFVLIYSLTFRRTSVDEASGGELAGAGIQRSSLITAFVTAAFFALHPLHVESVAWATERRDLLYSLFYLLSIYFYILYAGKMREEGGSSSGGGKGREGRGRLLYCASLVLFTLSLLSKSMAVTLPAVLLLIDYYPLSRLKLARGGGGRGNLAVLIEKAPYFALALAAAVAAILAMSYGNALVSIHETPIVERLLISVRAFSFYIYKIVLPVNLSPVYPYPLEVGFFKAEFLLAIALAAAVAVVSILSLRRTKLVFIAWAYFLIALFPVIGIMRIGYLMSAADRYTYLPIIGPLLLSGALAAYFYGRAGRRGRIALALVVALISLLFAAGTVKQSYIWKDSFTLWDRQTALYPERSFVAYANRAEAYLDAGDPDRAIADYTTALRIRPGDVNYHADRGAAYFVAGDFENAIKDIDTALTINPGHVDARFRRGMLFAAVGLHIEAIREYTAALTTSPDFAEAYNTRGIARQKIGNIQGAMADYLAAVEKDPTLSVAHFNLARLYEKKGNASGALRHYEAAAKHGDEMARGYLKKLGRGR